MFQQIQQFHEYFEQLLATDINSTNFDPLFKTFLLAKLKLLACNLISVVIFKFSRLYRVKKIFLRVGFVATVFLYANFQFIL